MKRQLILGLVLVLLVFIAFGTYFFVDQYQNKQEKKAAEESAALQLSTFDSSAVTKLDLHTPDLDYTVEPNDSSEWVVTNVEDMHINSYYITALCTYGCQLSATKDLGEVDSDTLESYGLSDPISITYYTDSGTTKLYIGNQSPTKEYFYMMREGSDNVFLADADTAGYLYVTESQLRYRYILEDTSSSIDQVSLKKDGDVIYDLSGTTDGDWKMSAPFDVPLSVDKTNVTELFALLVQLEADDFGDSDITEADYAEYGFDQPAYTLQMTQENGTVTTLLFDDYDPLVTSYVNCLHVETGEILVFDSSYLSFLQEETKDYLLETLYKPGIDDVASVQLQYQGSFNDKTVNIDMTLDLDTTNEVYSCNGTAISADDSDTVTALRAFFTQASNLSYDSIASDAALPEDAVAAFKLQYTMNDGTTHLVELIPNDDTTYWARVDGEFTCALVRQRELSGEKKILERYTTLMTLVDTASE